MPREYNFNTPTSAGIREGLQFAIEHWRTRNDYFAKMRTMIQGRNQIPAPQSTQYAIRKMHMYYLSAVINEKVARFLNQPIIQAIPENSSEEARAKSSSIERAIQAAFYNMELNGDGDVWSRLVFDAIVFDQGVEIVERAPAAFWPEATLVTPEGKPLMVFETEDKLDAYKKLKGLPIRNRYVKPESYYPIYEGATAVENYEIEYRSLRSILRNQLFDFDRERYSISNDTLRTLVPIAHYDNQLVHAYYMLWPGADYSSFGEQPNPENVTVGEPVLLHAYQHKLGRSQYNVVGGRFGGWKTTDNNIVDINNGILELNQVADEVASQMLTYVRATKWPTHKFIVNPELRGTGLGGPPPKPPVVDEGQSFTMFVGEDLSPLFSPVEDDQVMWIVDQIKEQIARLGGSPVLFGQRQPGVETGYHQNLQITQSEHLDEKIEQHLSQGAIQRASLIMQHVRAMNETVWCHSVQNTAKGGKTGEYIKLEPSQLVPLPRLDAAVRRPRPVDLAAAIRSAREASDDRGGKGPLLSDDAIRSDLLGRQAPDEEEYKIIVQEEKLNLRRSGMISQLIAQRLNLKLVQQSAPAPVDPTAVDPAVVAAMQTVADSTARVTGDMNQQRGMPTGQSQPEANAGQQIANAEPIVQ